MKSKFTFARCFLVFLAVFGTAFANSKAIQPQAAQQNLKVLFVQTAHSAELIKKNNNYYLTLNDIDDFVSFFTNRPKRIGGLIPITEFAAYWGKNDGKFVINPPNVAITTVYSDNTQKLKHIEIFAVLTNLQMNLVNDSITYEVKPLKNNTINLKPMRLGYTAIFFDSVMIHWGGGGF